MKRRHPISTRTDTLFPFPTRFRSHLPLPDAASRGLRVPPSSIARTDPGLYPRMKRAADAAGVAVDGWVIAFHKTDLATANPEAAIENCFGDPLPHGL